MKPKYYRLFTALSFLMVFVAVSGIKPACATVMYQPKAPRCLAEKK